MGDVRGVEQAPCYYRAAVKIQSPLFEHKNTPFLMARIGIQIEVMT